MTWVTSTELNVVNAMELEVIKMSRMGMDVVDVAALAESLLASLPVESAANYYANADAEWQGENAAKSDFYEQLGQQLLAQSNRLSRAFAEEQANGN